MTAATMVVFPITKLSQDSDAHDILTKPAELAPGKCSERAELIAWSSVGRRIAAVFVEAANEIKAEELKMESSSHSTGLDGSAGGGEAVPSEALSSDCAAKAMCSPAPSSVFPTDVSTRAGTVGSPSEADSDSGDNTDYDFFSELENCDDDSDCSISPGSGFKVNQEAFKGIETDFEKASSKTLDAGPGVYHDKWRRVGQRLAAVMLAVSDSEDDDFPYNEGLTCASHVP